MKKVLSCLLVIMLLAGTVYADNFVNSVANAGAPKLAGATDADGGDAGAAIVITPYDEKDELPEALKKDMEDAFESLSEAGDLTALNDELKAAAADKNIAVSDLFDIRAVGEVKFPVTVELENENVDDFTALLHFADGKWEWVDTEVKDGKITFQADSLSPFAMIVAVEETTSAKTGESFPVGYVLGAVVLLGAAAWFFFKSRKVTA